MIEYRPRGVCSQKMLVELEDGRIKDIEVVDGCNGNIKGVITLLEGMDAEEAVKKLRGITCKSNSTSCPDQLSYAIEKALNQAKAAD